MISIFTDNLKVCAVTGRSGHVEVHHIFGAANRTRSTFYGFVIPLLAEIHPNGARRDDKACQNLTGKTIKELDTELKQACQRHYEDVLGKSREEWRKEFGRSYL